MGLISVSLEGEGGGGGGMGLNKIHHIVFIGIFLYKKLSISSYLPNLASIKILNPIYGDFND